MEDIITAVLDIEHEAQDIINKARKTAELSKERTKNEIEKLSLDYETRVNEHILKMQQNEERYCVLKLEELQKNCRETASLLDEKYENNKEKWVDMLFSYVFGDLK